MKRNQPTANPPRHGFGGELMWKCKYCEKTNFDDQIICPYCNAPNPAAANRTPATPNAGTPLFYGSQSQSNQDWNARYNPNVSAKSKIDSIVKYAIEERREKKRIRKDNEEKQ